MAKHMRKNTSNKKLMMEQAKLTNEGSIELYEEMNYFELLDVAKQRGIAIRKGKNKNGIIKILQKKVR